MQVNFDLDATDLGRLKEFGFMNLVLVEGLLIFGMKK
jgi:hypothetical protein